METQSHQRLQIPSLSTSHAALVTTKPAAADCTPGGLAVKPAAHTSSLPAAQKTIPGVAAVLGSPALARQASKSPNRHAEMARKITLFMGAEMQPQVCPESVVRDGASH